MTSTMSPIVQSWLDEPASPQLLPDPDPRPVQHTIISVDDHLVEPPWLFEGRLEQRFADRAPKMVENDSGGLQWVFDGETYEQMGLNALAGRVDRSDVTFEPMRLADMRRGAYDIHHRIKDMDLAGVWGTVCFPSQITGFCGRVYSSCSDPALGLAVTRAFNDWVYEEWHGAYPDRVIPMGITWLQDAQIGADEIRRNAARGFTAVTLPEQPSAIDLPSLHSGWWDPIFDACVETDTVVCLHIGSAGSLLSKDPEGPFGVGATLFQLQSYVACAEWVWSGLFLRFPTLRVVFSEGGIGWVAMLHDRLKHQMDISGHGVPDWPSGEIGPHEALLRNGWFCTINDPSTMSTRHVIGVDHVMIETDYPHADGTWPDCQLHASRLLEGVPADEARAMTFENAARLFRHTLPPSEARG